MYTLFIAITILLCSFFCELYGIIDSTKVDEWTKKMFAGIPTIICIIICLIGIIASVSRMEVQIKKIEDKLDPKKQSNYNIIRYINNDKKYLYNDQDESDKTEFNKLSIVEIRRLKVYYALDYKLAKKDTFGVEIESDLEEYLGGKNESYKLIGDLFDITDNLNWIHILTAISCITILWEIFLIICVAIPNFLWNRAAQRNTLHNWAQQNGFFQKCYIKIQYIEHNYLKPWAQ